MVLKSITGILQISGATLKSHIDLMLFLCNWNNYNAVSMDIACRSFNIPSPKEGEAKVKLSQKPIEDGKIVAVNEYFMRNVEATHRLF